MAKEVPDSRPPPESGVGDANANCPARFRLKYSPKSPKCVILGEKFSFIWEGGETG